MRSTLKYYSSIYEPLFKKSYTKSSDRSVPALKLLEQISKKESIEVSSVLDVGCAWGKALNYWKGKKIKAVGIDVSKRVIKKCMNKKLECYFASATDLSIFKDKQFNLYMATDVYEHLRTEDLEDAIKEAKRVTNGYFLIRPHPALDKRKVLHLTVWALDEWKSFFESKGFKILFVGDGGKKDVYRNVFLMKNKND